MRILAIVGMALMLAACAPPALALRMPEAPTPAEPGHEVGSFVGTGGVQLFEQSWHPAGTALGVVVIHHGLKSHSAHYAELARHLVARGFAVYAYDMRGHGRSSGPRASLDDFEELVSDLDTFVRRVQAREPGRPTFVIGHSVGGAVVTLYALERHPSIAGLVLLAPALRTDTPTLVLAAGPLTAALMPNFPVVDVPDSAFLRDPAMLAEMGSDPLIYHPVGPARTGAALLRALEQVWARAEELEVPLLALHGTADRATDPRGSAEIVRRARSRDKTLLLYRGLYHDLVREPEREAVMNDIVTWIERHTPPR